ncbi:sorting nexin-17-like [Xenia sp. Carnegie-2017]|uniref:sorting nexin-17-like n=1 Tax=Xenia sp. Carnegie-2017 TaxID=2897299 RepID=UPI001F041A5F|nr:sorting nexin-17-like [Xenia sp. Carnegie-2017]
MHFAILDIEQRSDENGSYVSYGISINGGFHSSIRYRNLRVLHEQLKKEFGDHVPDSFPPKKILSLNHAQLQERRDLLEKYLQAISQDPMLINSKTFIKFLLNAQKETCEVEEKDVELDVYLLNGKKFQVKVKNTASTDHVMELAMSHIKLPENMAQYFSLFLVEMEDEESLVVVRKLQGFESPSLVLLPQKQSHRLIVRKNFWDSSIEDELYEDKIALNLLFVQAVCDVERDWVITSPETMEQLNTLKIKNERKKYLQLARKQKFYGYVQFKPCLMDFPESETRVLINTGGYELNFRIIGSQNTKGKEGNFKVTRIRCWRVISSRESKNDDIITKICFEYLFSKSKLQWITIVSDQAMLISLCLQGMVDELIKNRAKNENETSKSTTQVSLAKEKTSSAHKKDTLKERNEEETKSDETSVDGNDEDKNEELPSTNRRSKKVKSKKILSVKNEVFAQHINDDDL